MLKVYIFSFVQAVLIFYIFLFVSLVDSRLQKLPFSMFWQQIIFRNGFAQKMAIFIRKFEKIVVTIKKTLMKLNLLPLIVILCNNHGHILGWK